MEILKLKILACLSTKDPEVHFTNVVHFSNGDAINDDPSLTLGKRFASPMKSWTARSKRAKARRFKALIDKFNASKGNSSQFSSPTLAEEDLSSPSPTGSISMLSSVDSTINASSECTSSTTNSIDCYSENTEVIVNTALPARIELLQAENKRLKNAANAASLQNNKQEPLSMKQICHKQSYTLLFHHMKCFWLSMNF